MSQIRENSRASRLMGWLMLTRTAGRAYGNPRIGNIELYDPAEEQIRAMIQGIYESKVEEELEAPFYDAQDRRLDVMSGMPIEVIRKFQTSAYRIGKGNARKFGYTTKTSTGVGLTTRAIAESHERYHDYDNLISNRQSYEETLGLVRVEGFYRVTLEPAGFELKYFVWPLVKGQNAPRAFASLEEANEEKARRNRHADPRKTGRWWKLPQKRITKRDLSHWLPFEKFWSLR